MLPLALAVVVVVIGGVVWLTGLGLSPRVPR